MKDKALSLAFRLFGAKFLRQLLAAVGGWFAAQGAAVDAFDLPSLLAGIAAWALSAVWSYLQKAAPDADAKTKISLLSQAAAAQLLAFLAGWLQSLGYAGSIDDTIGVTVFLGNYGLSQLSRPDPKTVAGNPLKPIHPR